MAGEEEQRKYIATFWRNDGGWHELGYERCVSYVFSAKSDRDALKLALAYATRERRPKMDFGLQKLSQVQLREMPLAQKDRSREVPFKKLEERLKAADFQRFK